MTESDVLKIIEQDEWMMHVLKIVSSLNLPDCWVGAGFVRNKVWDSLHEYTERTPLTDVDVVYFDTNDATETREKELEAKLRAIDSTIPWSVKNQARMHIVSNLPAYISTEDAIRVWPETPTAVAVRLNDDAQLELLAPHGITDLVTLVVKPSPHSYTRPQIYEKRIATKGWKERWPKLTIIHTRDES